MEVTFGGVDTKQCVGCRVVEWGKTPFKRRDGGIIQYRALRVRTNDRRSHRGVWAHSRYTAVAA